MIIKLWSFPAAVDSLHTWICIYWQHISFALKTLLHCYSTCVMSLNTTQLKHKPLQILPFSNYAVRTQPVLFLWKLGSRLDKTHCSRFIGCLLIALLLTSLVELVYVRLTVISIVINPTWPIVTVYLKWLRALVMLCFSGQRLLCVC